MKVRVITKNYRILKFKGKSKNFAEYPIEERIPTWAKPYEQLAKTISIES